MSPQWETKDTYLTYIFNFVYKNAKARPGCVTYFALMPWEKKTWWPVGNISLKRMLLEGQNKWKVMFIIREHQPPQCSLTTAHKSSCWSSLAKPMSSLLLLHSTKFYSAIFTTSQTDRRAEWHVWSDESFIFFCSGLPLKNGLISKQHVCFFFPSNLQKKLACAWQSHAR